MFRRYKRVRLLSFGLIVAVLLQFLPPVQLAYAEDPPNGTPAGPAGGSALPPPPVTKKSYPKLDGALAAIAEAYDQGGVPAAADAVGRDPQVFTEGEQVLVVIESEIGQEAAIEALVQANGGQVTGRYLNLVQARAPFASLKALERGVGILQVRLPLPHQADVLSEGVSRINASIWQQQGLMGQGVKVAVVDTGFSGYASLLGTELPASVTTACFCGDGRGLDGGGEVHGTGVAEIIHDIAPNAQLYLVRIATDVDLGNAVNYLAAQGVSVVNHSVGWFNTGGGDGTGTINSIIASARTNGILWVNSAGNYGQRYWEGWWTNNDGDAWHEFSGADETNTLTIPSGVCITIYLSWSDWSASAQDYDLVLYDSAITNVVAQSVDAQTGSQKPRERLTYCSSATQAYHIAIKRYSATLTVKFRMFVLSVTPEYYTASGSLTAPADSADVLSVGAVAYYSNFIESYSSQGPTQDGRIKPDLVAPARVSTVSYGTTGFAGTSASSPHVAGAAALVRQGFPMMTPAQVQAYLEQRGTDMGAAGKDNVYGAGHLAFAYPHGALDPTFGSGGKVITDLAGLEDYIERGLAIQADGKIVVAGSTWNGSHYDFALSRYAANGTPDSTFGNNGKVTVDLLGSFDFATNLAVQSDGKLVTVGHTWNGNDYDFALLRVLPDGTLDSGFGTNGRIATDFGSGSDYAWGIAIQPDGKIITAGKAAVEDGTAFGIVRVNTDGSLDASFGTGGKMVVQLHGPVDSAADLLLLPDGKIVVGGHINETGNSDFGIIRLNQNGSLDLTFGTTGKALTDFFGDDDRIGRLAIQSDGKIIAAGTAQSSVATAFALARHNLNGLLDTDFGYSANGKQTVTYAAGQVNGPSVVVQADGNLVLAGTVATNNGNYVTLTGLTDTGGFLDEFGLYSSITTDFPGGPYNSVVMAVQSDGRVVLAGTTGEGAGRDFVLARYLASTPGALQFSTPAYTVAENGGSAAITVTRTGGNAGAVSVTAATITGGGATAGSDYTATSVTLSWADGDTAPKTFTVPITNDATSEPDETVMLALSNPTGGATLGLVNTAALTINDDEPASHLLTVQKSGAGTGTVTSSPSGINCGSTCSASFDAGSTVTLSAAADSDSQFAGWTGDGCSGTGACQVTLNSAVTVTATFNVIPPPPGALQFSTPAYTVAENGGSAAITVTRTGGNTGAVSVTAATITGGGTAALGTDYTHTSTALFWPDGDTAPKTFSVPIVNDALVEPDETVMLALSNPTGGATLGLVNTATLTITNDDAAGYGPYGNAVAADSPRGHWQLNEASGTIAGDSSGNGNHGTLMNGVALGQPGALPAEPVNTALALDGVNDYVTAPDSPSLSPTSAVSVEAWVKLDAYSGSYPRLLSKPGAYELTMYTTAGAEGRLEWKVSLAGGDVLVNTAYADRLLLGQWHHVVGTYDGSNLRIFINGVQKASKPASGAVKDSTSPFTISRADRAIAARVDEVAVYGAALPAARVQAHFNAAIPAVALTSGDGQAKATGAALDAPFVVTVTDSGGVPVAGMTVTWEITGTPPSAAGQSLAPAGGATTTDASGQTSATLTLGDRAGTYTVTATATAPGGQPLRGSPVTFTATAQTASAYAQVVLADSPAGYWRLNEGSGAQAGDLSGNSNTGTFLNGVTLGAAGALPDESEATAITLDGVNDTVTVPDAASLSPTAAVAVEAWVKLDAYSGSYPRLLSKPGAYELTIYTVPGHEGRLEWKVSLAGGDVLVNTTVADRLLLGQWHHVAATYDGSNLRIFINGVQKAVKAASGAVKDSTSPFSISRADRAIAASMDEVAVYSAALPAARALAHYALGAPAAPPSQYVAAVTADSPAGYWRLNETGGNTAAADLSGNSNTGTYTNGVTQGVAGALTSESDAAAQFDGVNDYLRVPDAASLSPTAAVAVEAWVKLDAYSGSYPRLLSKPGAYELTMYTVPGHEGRLEWKVSLAGGDVLVNTTVADRLLLGQWHHVAGTYDGSNLRIFINGVQKAVKAASGAIKDSTSPLTVSRADRALAATLDEVAVYSAALPAARVQAHYAAR